MGSNLHSATFEETQNTMVLLGIKQIKTLIFSTLKQYQSILKTLNQ